MDIGLWFSIIQTSELDKELLLNDDCKMMNTGMIGDGGTLPDVRVELAAVVAPVGQSPNSDDRVGEHCG